VANQAYLFTSNSDPNDPFTWEERDVNARHFYWSRWTIPLAWFFFFQPDDIKLVDRFSAHGYLKDVSYWQEPKFMANKQQAFETFKQNEAALAQLVGPDLYSEYFTYLLPSLQRMPGECLCMDTAEIAQDNEADYLPLRQIVELIGNKDSPVQALQEAVSRFSKLTYKDEDDIRLNVVGYTYW